MKIDTLGVQAFIAIADAGSFNGAAEAIHITQTGLTRRLQNLEALLGVRLVERTTRSVALTPIGRDFLPRARRLLADLATALTEIRETGKALRGDVSIACVPTAGVQYLPRIIQRYAALYPNNRIKILDHASLRVAEAVLRREAEFGITLVGTHDPDLAGVPLLKDRFVLVCRDDHALAGKKKLAWKDLEPHPLIFSGLESGNRQLLDLALAGQNLSLQFVLRGAAQLDRRRPRGRGRRRCGGAAARHAEGRLSPAARHSPGRPGGLAHAGAALAQGRLPDAGGAGPLRPDPRHRIAPQGILSARPPRVSAA